MSEDVELSTLAADYLAIQRSIKDLESKGQRLRDVMAERLNVSTVTVPTVWDVGSAKITWVRGRESSKLDRGVLARLGVTADLLDKATVTTTGRPSIRVEAPDENL